MTSFVGTDGRKVAYDKELTSTTEHTVVSAATTSVERTIESIIVSSNGTSDTLTLTVKNGATVVFPMLTTQTIDPAAHPGEMTRVFSFPPYPRPLHKDHSITAQCGTGGRLWISIIMVERGAQDGGRK